MSKTEFGINDPLAVKVWSKELGREAHRQTFIGKFIGTDESSLIQEKVDLKKGAGDKITCGLTLQLQGDGVEGDDTMEGNEEALQFHDDAIIVDQLRNATRSKGKMSEQRVPYNMRNTAKTSLSEWYARRNDTAFFNQICGNTAVTDRRYTGLNPVTAPTSNRHIIAGGAATDQALTSSDIFTLEMLDVARVTAETSTVEDGTGPLIRPIRHEGNDYYVAFLHDFQVFDLRTNSASGQWLDIQKAALSGGDVKSNPIFTGALGIYNGIILHKAARVTTGVNSSTGAAISTVRRAALCGAQAATIAYGGDSSSTKYSWKEDNFDYGNQLGVSAGSIMGLKKTRFVPKDDGSSEDFATVVMSSYAVKPDLS